MTKPIIFIAVLLMSTPAIANDFSEAPHGVFAWEQDRDFWTDKARNQQTKYIKHELKLPTIKISTPETLLKLSPSKSYTSFKTWMRNQLNKIKLPGLSSGGQI